MGFQIYLFLKNEKRELETGNENLSNEPLDSWVMLWSIMELVKSNEYDKRITWNDNASPNKKKPAKPEQRKLAEKFVPVACNDERAFKLLT